MKCRRKLKGEIQPMWFCYFVRLRQMKWEVKTELSRHLKAFKTSLHVRAVCWVVKLLHWCWQGWDAVLYVCSSSSSSPGIQGLHLSLFLTLPLSLSHARTHTCSLSLSSVTLVTYFLHGNSISCCAHREKERRKKKTPLEVIETCVCVCVCNCGFKLGDLTYSSDEIELLLFCMSYHQIDCVIEQWTS